MKQNLLDKLFPRVEAEKIKTLENSLSKIEGEKLRRRTLDDMREYLQKAILALEVISEIGMLLETPEVSLREGFHHKATTQPIDVLGGLSLQLIFAQGDKKPICARLIELTEKNP